MIKPDIYKKHCNKCKKETPHIVQGLSRKRGIRLRCLKCGFIKGRYCKINAIEKGSKF